MEVPERCEVRVKGISHARLQQWLTPSEVACDWSRDGLKGHSDRMWQAEVVVVPTQPVAVIAREALVASVAVEDNGHVRPGDAGDMKRWNRRRVTERLVVVPNDVVDQLRRARLHD